MRRDTFCKKIKDLVELINEERRQSGESSV